MTVIGSAFIQIRPESAAFVGETTEKVKGGLSKIGNILGVGLALGIGEGIKSSLEAADHFEKAEARLKTAIKNTGGEFESYEKKLASAERQGLKFGQSNATIADALAQLTFRTGSAEKAFKDLGVAQDVAAGLGKDLNSTIALIAKAEAGSSTALKRLGITFTSTGDKAKDTAAILKLLGERFKGAAADQAETFAGKMAALKAEIGNVEQKIGLALIPVIEKLGGGLADTIDFVTRNQTAFEVIAGVVGLALVPAMEAYVVAQATAFGTGALRLVVGLGERLGILVVQTEAVTVAEVEATVAAGVLNGVSFAGLTASLAGVAAAAAPLAVLAGGFFILKRQLDNNEKSAKNWATEHVAAYQKAGRGIADLEKLSQHETEVSNLGWRLKLGPVQIFTDEHAKHAAYRQRDLDKEIEKLKETRDATAELAGVAVDAFEKADEKVLLFGRDLSTVSDKKELEALGKQAEKLRDSMVSNFADSAGAIDKFLKSGTEDFATFQRELLQQTKDDQKFAQDLLDLAEHGIKGPLIEKLEALGPKAIGAADQLVTGLSTGMTQHLAQVASAGELVANTATDKLKTIDTHQYGINITEGIALGMTSAEALKQLHIASSTVIDSIKGSTKAKIVGYSPSRLFAKEIGVPITQGILLGMEQGMDGWHGGSVIDRIKSGLGGLGRAPGGSVGAGGVNVHPGAVVVNLHGATGDVKGAAKHFEDALSRVLVRTRMGAGARG